MVSDQFKEGQVGLTEPRAGLHLITLSTFSPNAEGRAQYDRLFRDIDKNIEAITAGKAVIFDLQQNGGGSSSWSERVAGKLWGDAEVAARLARYFRKTQVWWLADSENIAHFHHFSAQFRADGRNQDAEKMEEVVRHLADARKRGDRFYVENVGASFAANAKVAKPRHFPPVYVILDGKCASACLDAVDVFKQFLGTKLVGAPTSADSNYLETRFQPFPSGRGGVVLPTKIWVGRPRGAGEAYKPDIPVNEPLWTTAGMLDHIERDLAGR